MPHSYEYDESDETWPFFLVTLLLVVVVPLTLSQTYRLCFAKSNTEEIDQEQIQAKVQEVNDAHISSDIKNFRKTFEKGSQSKIWNKRNLFLVIGWGIIAILFQRIKDNDAMIESATGLFDPYELLGVASSASDRDIKSAYRKLSVKLHPDKLSKDLSADERTNMEEMYVQITKAYEALTDEITKENYLRYGHPDGPQSTSHGIALPKFLVDGAASPLVVLSYVALLSVILPYLVSKWWARTQSYTKKGIHVKTASLFVDRLINYKPSEVVTVDLILKWLSNAEEFRLFYPNLTPADFEELLHDHLNRVDSSRITDKNVKLRIVSKCHSLLHGLLDIACGFRNTDIASVTLETFKCIVQAVPHTPYRQILQLPNVDQKKFLEGSVDEIHTLGKLFTYDDKKISKILGIDDENKLNQTLTVASCIPNLRLIRADFKVPGESQVTPLSTPHISVKLLVRSAKHKIIPSDKFPEIMLQEPQTFEFQKDPFVIMEDQPTIPYSYAPFFPTKRRNAFCCLVGLQKDGKLLQTPIVVEKLSFKNLTKNFDKRQIKDINKDFHPEEWEIATIKIPLGQPAPAETGDVFFRVIIKSTDYFTSDLDFTMTMQVRNLPVQTQQSKEDEEETENESAEDSENDEDEEEEDSDSDYTDIDTDTEIEEDAVDEMKK